MTMIAAWMAAWFTFSLMPSELTITVYHQFLWLYMSASFAVTFLLSWDFYSCQHTILLAFYAITKNIGTYTTILTAWLQVCFLINIVSWLYYLWLWFIYTPGTSRFFSLSYMTLLVINTIHICTCLILYVYGGTKLLCKLLSLQFLYFQVLMTQLSL